MNSQLENLKASGLRLFIWVQEMCNIHVPIPSRFENDLNVLIDAVSQRWEKLKSLEQEIDLLKIGKIPTDPSSLKLKTFKLVTDAVRLL
jgi:hypothetical protein